MPTLKRICLFITLICFVMALPGCATTPTAMNGTPPKTGMQTNHPDGPKTAAETRQSHKATYIGIGVGAALGIVGIVALAAIALHTFVFGMAAAGSAIA